MRRTTARGPLERKTPFATRLLRVRSVDASEACATETTVLQLYVVEGLTVRGESRHMVYLDSHGWYCTHGPDCEAIDVARRAHERAQRAP